VIKLDGIVGDGTVNTTARDLVKWNAAITSGGVFSPASLRAIRTPDTLTSGRINRYSYGLLVAQRRAVGLLLAHSGSWPGYQTVTYHFPDRKALLVILSNNEHRDNDLAEAARRLMGVFMAR